MRISFRSTSEYDSIMDVPNEELGHIATDSTSVVGLSQHSISELSHQTHGGRVDTEVDGKRTRKHGWDT